ncbi:pseudouridine synthase [Rhodobacter sp. NSM]|uniref:pseudouridine synthase n=1 Tax=Rhodobacter sp. NSM TaxID=3457501 RepID=UPI003FD5C477
MTDSKDGERIAKVLSRAGVASRRDAERMIELGRVAVNGRTIDSPALNVGPKDRITVDGQPLAPPEPPRLWLYYKPEGLVTSAADEKGRDTVFDHLPEDMPRVMSVGRLDLNSEGLLLLTNDGELKRRLELPSTGWLRKYRVRVKGNPTDPDLEPLRKGITVEGESFQPMTVTLDRLQGANAWLTIGLREGKNREIRRAMSAIGLTVNRLIRISYGPFRLNELQPGMVEEVRPKVLRDQLGLDPRAEDGAQAGRGTQAAARPARGAAGKPAAPRRSGQAEAPPKPARAGRGPANPPGAGGAARPRREALPEAPIDGRRPEDRPRAPRKGAAARDGQARGAGAKAPRAAAAPKARFGPAEGRGEASGARTKDHASRGAGDRKPAAAGGKGPVKAAAPGAKGGPSRDRTGVKATGGGAVGRAAGSGAKGSDAGQKRRPKPLQAGSRPEATAAAPRGPRSEGGASKAPRPRGPSGGAPGRSGPSPRSPRGKPGGR